MAFGEYTAYRYARHARYYHHRRHHRRHGAGRAYRQQRQRGDHLTLFDLLALALVTRRPSRVASAAPAPTRTDAPRVSSSAPLRARLTRIRQTRGLIRVVEADLPPAQQTPHIASAPPHMTPDWSRRASRVRAQTRAGTRGRADSGRTTTTHDVWSQPIVSERQQNENLSSSVVRPATLNARADTRTDARVGRPDLADDLLSGLTALGYRPRDIKPLVRDLCASAPPDTTIEQALTRALRLLAKPS